MTQKEHLIGTYFRPVNFIAHRRTISAIVPMMSGLLQFIRSRRLGRVIAVCVAYALAIQVLMASVGVGMLATTDEAGFAICVHSPSPVGDPQKPSPIPQCPFCLVAAQAAGHLGLAVEAPAFPAYAGLLSTAILDSIGGGAFVFHLHHRQGEPRAPPTFSV